MLLQQLFQPFNTDFANTLDIYLVAVLLFCCGWLASAWNARADAYVELAVIVLAALLIPLVVAGILFVVDYLRRRRYDEKAAREKKLGR